VTTESVALTTSTAWHTSAEAPKTSARSAAELLSR
jgi:hypothetical protein